MPKRRRKLKSRRKNSWKKLKVSYRLRRKLRLFTTALIVVISTLVVFFLLTLWQLFRMPFAEATGSYDQTASFPNEAPYNILLILLEDKDKEQSYIKSLALLSLAGREKSVSIITIPTQIKVKASFGFGEIPVEALYALGELKKPKMNTKIVTKTISSALAVPIEAYVLTDEVGFAEILGVLGEAGEFANLEAIFSFRHLPRAAKIFATAREVIRTNLSLSESLRIINFLVGVRSDRMEHIELNEADFANLVVLDGKIRRGLLDRQIFDEGKKVVVLNGTPQPGLAAQGARFVENLGGSVLRVGNFEDQNLKTSFIVVKDLESYSLKRLVRIFNIKETKEPSPGVGGRADITVIVGLDIQEEL